MSLIKTALGSEPESRFTLFYGNRDSNSVIFLEQLAALKDRYLGRFELYHFLSDEEGDVDLFNGMACRAACSPHRSSSTPVRRRSSVSASWRSGWSFGRSMARMRS